MKQFYDKVKSLSIEDGCLFYGNNIVVPYQLQNKVLDTLHENHVGIVKMKMIARSYVWWPKIQKDIENFVQNCNICQQTRNVPKEIVKTAWSESKYPFERIHLDFFYINGINFLIIVDSYSKFVDVSQMKSYIGNNLIKKLEHFFSVYGLPGTIVTDNGPPFNSNVFATYCKCNDIILMHSPPYHPQSNGLAERNVQTTKKVIIKFCMGKEKELNLQEKIDKYLYNSRNTPSITTGRTPNEMIFSYKPKIVLDVLNDKNFLNENVIKSKELGSKNVKENKKTNNVEIKKVPKFKVGENLLYQNHFKHWIKWIPAKVMKVLSTLTYLIEVNGYIRFVQENQLRRYTKGNKNLFEHKVYPRNVLDDFDKLPEKEPIKEKSDNIHVNVNSGKLPELRTSTREKRKPDRFTHNRS